MPLKYSLGMILGSRLPKRALRGRLQSPVLDKRLHPGCEASLVFDDIQLEVTGGEKTIVSIDGFQLHSIETYLECQTKLFKIVTKELFEARAAWTGDEENEAWLDDIVCDCIYLPSKAIDLADRGLESTESSFVIVLKTPWDEEHGQRTLKFRDRQFISLGAEGD